MTFRVALEEKSKYLGRGRFWCGDLPTGNALLLAFAEYRHVEAENYFPSPVHRFAAGLVAAHVRRAGINTEPDGIVPAWVLAEAAIVEYQAELDRVVAALIREPLDGAAEHHEGFGAFVNRMAHLYCNSPKVGPALGVPDRTNGAKLATELLAPDSSYSTLVSDLNLGLVRLPPGSHYPEG